MKPDPHLSNDAESLSVAEDYPASYVVEPTATHTHTAILVHGLGSNGRAFGSFFLTSSVISNDPQSPFSRPLDAVYPSMKWVFPSAALRGSTRFKRVRLFSWFDIFSVADPELRKEVQVEGLAHSSQYLKDLVSREVHQLSKVLGEGHQAEKRIVLGGLSQGCATSLMTLLSLDRGLGGWVGMSGFMPFRGLLHEILNLEPQIGDKDISSEANDADEGMPAPEKSKVTVTHQSLQALNSLRQGILSMESLNRSRAADVLATPVFYGHGSDDKAVQCKQGDQLVETIQQLGMKVTYQVYEGLGHWIQVPEEISDIISVFARRGAWPDHVDGKNHLDGIARPTERGEI